MFETDKRPHISVVGDLILDRYLIGDATKLNPEQPGVVIRVRKEDERLGGAAAVASIASGLGAHVTLAGVLGRDESGRRTLALVDSCSPHLAGTAPDDVEAADRGRWSDSTGSLRQRGDPADSRKGS
jgi:bifunctional ADP-heptose synthase (sugar kinase/adenylyltransferase)